MVRYFIVQRDGSVDDLKLVDDLKFLMVDLMLVVHVIIIIIIIIINHYCYYYLVAKPGEGKKD